MSVSVIGLDYDNVDGLEASREIHRKAHAANGDAILNIRDAVAAKKLGLPGPRKSDPRPPYVHQPFPKDLYSADGRTKTVKGAEELAVAAKAGFREKPYPVVRSIVGDPAAEKAAMLAKQAESDGKLASQNELLLKLQEQVSALLEAKTPEAKGK